MSLPAKTFNRGSVVATQQLIDVFGDGGSLHPSHGRALSTQRATPIPVAERLQPVRSGRIDSDANCSGSAARPWAVELDIEQIAGGRWVSRLFVHVLSQGMPVQEQHRVNTPTSFSRADLSLRGERSEAPPGRILRSRVTGEPNCDRVWAIDWKEWEAFCSCGTRPTRSAVEILRSEGGWRERAREHGCHRATASQRRLLDPGAGWEKRPATGRFLPGNLVALTHGQRSRQLLDVPAIAALHLRKWTRCCSTWAVATTCPE